MQAVANFFTKVKDAVTGGPVTMFPPQNHFVVMMDKPSYIAGDLVSGQVQLTLCQPLQCNSIILKVKGIERSRWTQTRTETRTMSNGSGGTTTQTYLRTHNHGAEKHFFREILVLFQPQAGGWMQPGIYTYPFQYQLPTGLPGTFFAAGLHGAYNDNFMGMILYKFKAAINVEYRHNLKTTVRLVVNEKAESVVAPSFADNDKSFMLTSGRLVCRSWLDKSTYFPGELVLGKLEANNTSEKSTRSLNVRIRRCIQLQSAMSSLVLDQVVFEATYHGFEPFFYGDRYLPFAIPMDCQPSTNGEYVRNGYVYVLECDIPGALDLSMKLPFKVVAPQFLFLSAPPQPKYGPPPPDVSFRPPPQKKVDSSRCTNCNTDFTMLINPDERCRHCLRLFCGKCSSSKSTIVNLGFPTEVRVCDACLPIAQEGGVNLEIMAAEVYRPVMPNLVGTLARLSIVMSFKKWSKKVCTIENNFFKNYDNEKDRTKNVVDWKLDLRRAVWAREPLKEEVANFKKQHLVVIVTKDEHPVFLEASSEKDAQQWIQALTEAIEAAKAPRIRNPRSHEEYLAHCRELVWHSNTPLFPPPGANMPALEPSPPAYTQSQPPVHYPTMPYPDANEMQQSLSQMSINRAQQMYQPTQQQQQPQYPPQQQPQYPPQQQPQYPPQQQPLYPQQQQQPYQPLQTTQYPPQEHVDTLASAPSSSAPPAYGSDVHSNAEGSALSISQFVEVQYPVENVAPGLDESWTVVEAPGFQAPETKK